ncbi:unnamed protein product [Didymodactylos carnosus]|uniref:Uncharacterized protein n=1 Tax=Didymodactylos carnosus TaxID=1234261 RepID=A0A815A5Y7_9BILA|nr:unnamed protein product [Didymodactylos carnosus]CAF4022275.1 unnamed protein product [Didymodactylos carnosus]
MKKCDKGTSPDPTRPQSQQPSYSRHQQGEQAATMAQEKDRLPVTANSEFFYSPMYRHYFGLTPPNPRLCNPRLLENYIDWYLNVYMEEELP